MCTQFNGKKKKLCYPSKNSSYWVQEAKATCSVHTESLCNLQAVKMMNFN